MKITDMLFMFLLFLNGQGIYGSEDNSFTKKFAEQEGTLNSLLSQAQDFRVKAQEMRQKVEETHKRQNSIADINKSNAKNDLSDRDVMGSSLLVHGNNSTIMGYIPTQKGRLQFQQAIGSFIEAAAVRNVKQLDIEFSEGSHSNRAVIYLSPLSDTTISAKTIKYEMKNPLNHIIIYSWYKPKVEAIGGVSVNVCWPLHYLLLPGSVLFGLIIWIVCSRR